MRKRSIRTIFCHIMVLAMLCSLLSVVPEAAAAQGATLKNKSITLEEGASKKIKILNKTEGASYKFTSKDKTIAKVTAAGKVKALKAGTVKVAVKEINGKTSKKIGTVTVKVTAKKLPVEDTVVYKNYFEDGDMNGFGTRGANAVEISNAKNHSDSGTNSLYVTKRTANWNGASLPLSKLVEVGTAYSFSAWVLQDSGTAQTISMKFDYKDAAGTAHYDDIDADKECPSGKWVEFSGTAVVPENQGDISIYFEMPSSNTLSFYVDDVVIKGKKFDYQGFAKTDENYEVMKKAGVYSTGNNARIKEVIRKARAGESVSLAYIGGSITSGGVASPNSNCYAEVSAKKFAAAYGKDGGANVHFVNAGMHGTPSDIGVVRYQRDVVARLPEGSTHPDILFIEFAVNDYGCATGGGAYEGLIREALDSGSAVVLVFSVFQTMNTVCENDYRKYGTYYDLPMVSMGNAIAKYYKEADFNDWYYGDSLHPNNQGHQLMADCIMELMDQIDKEDAEADNITDVNAMKPVKTAAYQGIQMIDASTEIGGAITSIEAGGFSERDRDVPNFGYAYKDGKDAPWFPDSWLHTATSGNDALKISLSCKTLMLVYKQNSQSTYGSADLYIDGVKKTTLNCYNASGWNNGTVYLALTEEEAAEHTIELRMASGSEGKKFSLYAIGYN